MMRMAPTPRPTKNPTRKYKITEMTAPTRAKLVIMVLAWEMNASGLLIICCKVGSWAISGVDCIWVCNSCSTIDHWEETMLPNMLEVEIIQLEIAPTMPESRISRNEICRVFGRSAGGCTAA
ncbi:hypothetical protein D3C74_419220 [compost metagenome]